MLIRIYRVDENSQKTLMAELQVDALRLMLLAEDREENTGRRRHVWAAGAVPFFAQELWKAIQTGQPRERQNLQATNVAISAWLHDSIYVGVTPEQFVRSDLTFGLLPDGAVKCERVMKVACVSTRGKAAR
ncbi:hypothetical protein ASF04_13015 [Duganella sp. Leaf61]|nr:hypothetical protein ASF04_13015 [Duganella sp. Leaf61]